MAHCLDNHEMLTYIVQQALRRKIISAKKLASLKREAASKFKSSMANDMDLLARYRQLVSKNVIRPDKKLEALLKTREIRTLSGVAVITVLTKSFPCPGHCLYCPSEKGMPKSYLSNEPAAMRAVLNKFDPYRQVQMRLAALEKEGHKTDKIELVVLGGTWSVYPKQYQNWFIAECFKACNRKSQKSHRRQGFGEQAKVESRKSDLSIEQLSKYLKGGQKKNETARHRIIGLTLETRPDYIKPAEIKRMRDLGCTRVELGVQSIYDDILKINRRGHTTQEIIRATKLLKDASFKINYHLMPNLPGSTLKKDEQMFKQIFTDSNFQPDLLKIYPCVVLKDAPLYKYHQQKKYKPYTKKQLIALLVKIKQHIPPYVRIQRIIRDIPSDSIMAGNRVSNLRQILDQKKICRCIRCREVRNKYSSSPALAGSRSLQLFRYDYAASGGQEIFLSLEDKSDRLHALLRLRIPSAYLTKSQQIFPVLENAALIREVHTYGEMASLSQDKKIQHRGLGKKLIREAEKIVRREFKPIKKVAVISGIGARDYYRQLGYRLRDGYMVKNC